MTVSKTAAPCGSWESPLKADAIASHSLRLSQIAYDGDDMYFLEGRPGEGGRTTIIRREKDGLMTCLLETPYNVRTLVHEYGGGAFTVDRGKIYFVNYSDQRIYRLEPGKEPIAITPPLPPRYAEAPLRYADLFVDRKNNRIVCVCEDHVRGGEESVNKIVSIDIADMDAFDFESVTPVVLAQGYDFYSNPRVSPDGSFLSYLGWHHPNMPWDGTNLHLASLDASGFVRDDVIVAGGIDESIFQPSWSPDSRLFYISDKTDWWNFYEIREPRKAFEASLKNEQSGGKSEEAKSGKSAGGASAAEPVLQMDAEFGYPMWIFGLSTYTFLDGTSTTSDARIACTYNKRGLWTLAVIEQEGKKYKLGNIESPYTDFMFLESNGKKVAVLAGSPSQAAAVVEFDPATSKFENIKSSSPLQLDAEYISRPEVIEFPTENGKTAFAFYYPPTNKNYSVPHSELPPLLVKSHGGPTGATSSVLGLGTQYWTSRGFAVVDVNYGGSTGYGRAYRNRLKFNWGVVDVKDCENAAKYLINKGLVDGHRLAITGGSAGGYTTLCVLTFGDMFKAGASHFGVADAEALCRDTHKFESRYGDYLFGPYPEKQEDYYNRSPIHFTDQLNCPVIFFQGLEDKVVPPSQSEEMVEALRKKKLPVAYIAYEGEQHGFRRAENIKRTIEAEFYFHSRIFGFEPADDIEPVEIENLAMLGACREMQ